MPTLERKRPRVTREMLLSRRYKRRSLNRSSGGDPLEDLVDLQGSSGVFKWGPAMQKLLKMSESDLNAKKPLEFEFSDEVWLTLVAVALLEMKMSEKNELWELVADKAVKFAKKQLGGDEEKLGKIREAAKKMVTN